MLMSDAERDCMNAVLDDIECLVVTAQSELSRQSLLADLTTWVKNRADARGKVKGAAA